MEKKQKISVSEFVRQVKSKEIDIVEHTHRVIEECRKINKEYNYFNIISDELALEQAKELKQNPKGRLAGVAVSVKDCICVKGVESRAGSAILNGYKPVFDATVVSKIKKEGAIIIGKTSQDAFGFGGFSVNVGKGFKVPLNPFDKTRSTGGSSGGAAGITQKATFPHIALAESTGGSIVNPASFCGVAGLCPTYGRVSRYGLMDYANSLDKIGTMSRKAEDSALMMEIIAGYDDNESTSLDKPVESYASHIGKGIKNMKIGLLGESTSKGVDEAVKDRILDGVLRLEAAGASVQEVSLPVTEKYSLPTYYLIAMAEASTNLAKYCGMRYGAYDILEGSFNEYFSKIRSHNFDDESKRRVIIGTFARMAGYRDAYYLKATKVRTKIIEEYKRIFSKYDCIISPVTPILPPKFSELDKLSVLQVYLLDIFTVGANLAGLPHISVNAGFKDNLPVGMLLIGNHLQEGRLLQIASNLDLEFNLG